MKLLQNRLFVGILAALALALLVNALWPVLTRSSSRRTRPKVTGAPVQSAVASAPIQSSAMSAPIQSLAERLVATATNRPAAQRQSLDLSTLQNSAPRWAASPRRDPFQMRGNFTGEDYPPAMELLKLTAVWRQTGGALATINNHVLSEGDPILKFKIEKIDSDVVWVQGPNGREQVQFARPGPAQTNSTATPPQPLDSDVKKPFL